MHKRVVISTILFTAVLIFSFFLFSQEKDKNDSQTNETTATASQAPRQVILFYGDGCPHCAIVEAYIKENNIENRFSFTQKEVYYNYDNAKELQVKAQSCGLPTDSIGVPFLWDGGKCVMGDQDIINFFKQKTHGQ